MNPDPTSIVLWICMRSALHRLTDPSSFTGTHKQRDRNRGGRRRSSASTTPLRASSQPTTPPTPGQSAGGAAGGATSTVAAASSASVFNRLSHPSSFTGMHRERKEDTHEQKQQKQNAPDSPMNDSPRHAHAKALGLVPSATAVSPAKAKSRQSATEDSLPTASRKLTPPTASRKLAPASPATAAALPRYGKGRDAKGKDATDTRRAPPPPPPLVATAAPAPVTATATTTATATATDGGAGADADGLGLAHASASAHRAQDAERRRRSSIRDERLDRLRSVGSRLDDLHRQMSRLEANRGCHDRESGSAGHGSPSVAGGVDPMVAAERAWEGALREVSAGTQEEKENSNKPTNRRRQVEI